MKNFCMKGDRKENKQVYFQITNVCNRKCEHCCFSCSDKGSFMSRKTFIAAAEIADEYGQNIDIGGGEPTLHPLFWDFMGIALSHRRNCESIWLATNGSVKDIALTLADMAKNGTIGVRLSRDQFHRDIDEEVVKAFTRKPDFGSSSSYPNDQREMTATRIPSINIINAGRAKKNKIGHKDGCPCSECFITPRGRIYACACKKESWGTVFKPEIPQDAVFDDYCSRNLHL